MYRKGNYKQKLKQKQKTKKTKRQPAKWEKKVFAINRTDEGLSSHVAQYIYKKKQPNQKMGRKPK